TRLAAFDGANAGRSRGRHACDRSRRGEERRVACGQHHRIGEPSSPQRGAEVSPEPNQESARAKAAMTRANPLLPRATIAGMGGGQLGRMFAFAARRMGYRVHTFSPERNGPAAQVSDEATAASYDDETAVRQFARKIDVLTFEFENIPARSIEWAARDQVVRP